MTVQEAAGNAAELNECLRSLGYGFPVYPPESPRTGIATLPYGRVATFPDPLTPGLPKDQVYEVVYCDHDGKPRATVSDKTGPELLAIIQSLAQEGGTTAYAAGGAATLKCRVRGGSRIARGPGYGGSASTRETSWSGSA